MLDLKERKSRCMVTPNPPLSMRPCVWSPDGEYIIYWVRETPVGNSRIWRLTLDNGETKQLISFPKSSARVGSPFIWYLSTSVSPFLKSNIWIDQEQFIFLCDVKGYDSFGISSPEGEIEWVDDKSKRDKEFYQVSLDRKFIACNEYVDGTTNLVFLSLEEGIRKEVTTDGCLSCPTWSKEGVYCWGSSPTEGTGILHIRLEGEPEYSYREPPPYSTFQPVPIHYKTFDDRKIGAWLYNEEAKRFRRYHTATNT
ncbi:MAG: hypothetical protein HXS46_16925 [Theionarchaea archaeon]|nr:hypothetical protein [Theionarchaea archaeon]